MPKTRHSEDEVHEPSKGFEAGASHRDEQGRLEVEVGIPGYPALVLVAHVDDRSDPAVIIQTLIRQRDGHAPPQPVTVNVHRAVRFEPLSRLINKHLAINRAVEGRTPVKLPDPAKARARSDEFYVAVAARYAALVSEGVRNPNVILAGQLDKEPSQIRDLIHTCRNRRLLTSAGHGGPGGQLTDLAIELLEQIQPRAKGTSTRRK